MTEVLILKQYTRVSGDRLHPVGDCPTSINLMRKAISMNSDNLIHLVQKGFRVTLGATATLVETLQDPQKREQNFSQIRSQFGERVEDWAEKGEYTEQEARNFVDSLLRQPNNQQSSTRAETSTTPVTTTPTPAAPPDVQLEMQELTAQIAAMRAELEKLRNPSEGV